MPREIEYSTLLYELVLTCVRSTTLVLWLNQKFLKNPNQLVPLEEKGYGKKLSYDLPLQRQSSVFLRPVCPSFNFIFFSYSKKLSQTTDILSSYTMQQRIGKKKSLGINNWLLEEILTKNNFFFFFPVNTWYIWMEEEFFLGRTRTSKSSQQRVRESSCHFFA